MRDIHERTLEFALRVIKLQLDEQHGVARTWQLLRAGTSIGANVEEAQAGQSRLDFISTNAIALEEAQRKGSDTLSIFAFFLLPFSFL